MSKRKRKVINHYKKNKDKHFHIGNFIMNFGRSKLYETLRGKKPGHYTITWVKNNSNNVTSTEDSNRGYLYWF